MTAVIAAAYALGRLFSLFEPVLGPLLQTVIGKFGMPLFYTDSLSLAYSDIGGAKHWWIKAFDCKVKKVPPDWDCPLPSDVALQLPGHDAPTILLSARSEVEQAGYDRPSSRACIIFCRKLKKGYEQLASRAVLVGPIQDGGGTEFFEIRDTEGNAIQVCKEP